MLQPTALSNYFFKHESPVISRLFSYIKLVKSYLLYSQIPKFSQKCKKKATDLFNIRFAIVNFVHVKF